MKSRGFTLIELLVSVGIFALMTALVVAKYGNFNQSVLLTNLAYDVALTIRTAQTYGLSVKSQGQNFSYAYGVNFSPGNGVSCGTSNGSVTTSNSSQFVMFADSNPADNLCGPDDISVSAYSIKRGAAISGICVGSDTDCTMSTSGSLNISFKRPDPSAVICLGTTCGSSYAQIEVKATDGSTRIVEVRDNGQISVKD